MIPNFQETYFTVEHSISLSLYHHMILIFYMAMHAIWMYAVSMVDGNN